MKIIWYILRQRCIITNIYIFSTSRYLDGREKPKKTNDKAYNKTNRKEKTRESGKRSYKKECKKKIVEEKENMKVQQAPFDKILPGVQVRCAGFFLNR